MNIVYDNPNIPFPQYQYCDIDIRLLGLAGLNPYIRHNSSPRQAMMVKHIGQVPVIKNPDIRRIQSGIDREYGRYTHKVKFENNSIVLKVIQKYPSMLRMNNNIRSNPLTVVVYENADSDIREVDIKKIPSYHCLNPQFGFDFKPHTRYGEYIRTEGMIPAGTVIVDSPAIDEDGNYRNGVQAKVAYTSSAGGIEDGITVSESFLKKLSVTLYEERQLSFGSKYLPLNIYGNDERFKIFPDVGERIGEDGVLAALREYDVALAPCDLSAESMQAPNTFDEYVYAYPGAEIVDIDIVYNPSKDDNMLTGMEEQLEKYLGVQHLYYETIIKEYKRLMNESRGKVRISNEFHRLVVDAMAMTDQKQRIKYKEKANKMDNWTVNITFKYELPAAIGFKLTDLSGGKGVICKVKPDHEMLMDADGNQADIEMDADSVIKRMNLAKLYEQYVNASGSATQKRLARMIEADNSPEGYAAAWQYVLGWYKIASRYTFEAIAEAKLNPYDHIHQLIDDGFYIAVPPNAEVDNTDVIRLLQQYYPACYGPCTYVGQSGKTITTKSPILIGEVYFILLDKIANGFSSVSSAKLQHYGLPAKMTRRNKYAGPTRITPTRTAGESEVRLFINVAGGKATADLLDRSSNPQVHRQIVKGILRAPEPTNVYDYVNRQEYPVGKGTILNLTHHLLACAGLKLTKGDDTDDKLYNRY